MGSVGASAQTHSAPAAISIVHLFQPRQPTWRHRHRAASHACRPSVRRQRLPLSAALSRRSVDTPQLHLFQQQPMMQQQHQVLAAYAYANAVPHSQTSSGDCNSWLRRILSCTAPLCQL
ncbi:hypothetical protein D9Q98_005932 [Chlorella vulgaris]|uniref:Uncharacterized protein n=1 Tax=Chlorella vulgaris TaxID=3077 RepID=A0A9D4Z0T5_CHLVU|nr:hypothetical protein D9Q98_005932 [Chlorella vulgaris]